MLTAATNRDLIVMADFESGYWVWQYCKSLPPSPILDGQLPGYGVRRSIQIELHSWFEAGQQAFKAGMLDWHGFNSKGEELANSLADESMNRFSVFYGRSPRNHEEKSEDLKEIHGEGSGGIENAPFRSGSAWESKISICFGYPRSGWILLAILSNAFNSYHVIQISDVFNPFPDMVSWISNIALGKSSILQIDEEGHYSYMTARIMDDTWFELIVEVDYQDVENELIDTEFPLRKILAVVNRKAFVKEFYRRFTDFLNHEYQDDWADFDLRNLDLSPIRDIE